MAKAPVRGPSISCAGAQPQLSDPANAEETAWWVAFEGVVAVGWR
jgi:hypothetical protein